MTDSENPFVLLARITVKEGMVEEYLEIAEACLEFLHVGRLASYIERAAASTLGISLSCFRSSIGSIPSLTRTRYHEHFFGLSQLILL